MNYQRLIRISLLFFVLTPLLFAQIEPAVVYAHGGTIVDGGFTDEYEWLVSVSPFPIVEGESVLTLLIYDLDTYDPVDGLEATFLLAPPGSAKECCAEGTHRGPFAFEVDPEVYPGDYSQFVQFDQVGDWGVRLIAKGEDTTLDAVISLTILPADPSGKAAEGTPDRAATETAFAQNVEAARQSPLQTPAPAQAANQPSSPLDSPLTSAGNSAGNDDTELSVFSSQTLIWLGLALIPILLLLLWMVRPNSDPSEAEE